MQKSNQSCYQQHTPLYEKQNKTKKKPQGSYQQHTTLYKQLKNKE